MSRRKASPTRNTSTGTTFRLNEPGMGEYERAGLAGLYLSLTGAQAWERQRGAWPLPKVVAERLDELRNYVTNFGAPGFPLAGDGCGVRIEWRAGTELATLKAIVNWAWQVHDGVLFLPGVHRKREHLDCYYLRLHVHSGLLGTYFQFPRTLKRLDQEQRVERFDEEKTFTVSFRPISGDVALPQIKAVARQGVCNASPVRPLSNWVYPGSEPRFNNLGTKWESGWSGPARLAYNILFAPIACHFIKLPRSKVKIRGREILTQNWAYVVPHVRDVRPFQREFLRRNTLTPSNWPFYGEVAGIEDATLRYATRASGRGQCLTVVMGNAAYYHDQQKTRKNLTRDLAVTHDSACALVRYDIFNRAFPASNTVRPAKAPSMGASRGSHFVSLPSSRERITANVLRGDPWYGELAYVPFWQHDQVAEERKRSGESISEERLWMRKLRYERRQLMAIVSEDGMWDDPRERNLLEAFVRALRRLLNREKQALKRGGTRDLAKRWDNTMDKWHRRLLNAKTRLLLSAAVHELLALAARSPALRDGKVVEPGGPVFLLPPIDGESVEDRRTRNEAFHADFRRMLNHASEWKKVRDLALLALTTFTDRRLGSAGVDSATDDKEIQE